MNGINSCVVEHAMKLFFAAALAVLHLTGSCRAQTSAEDILRLGTQILKGIGPQQQPNANTRPVAPKAGKNTTERSQIVADAQRLLASQGYAIGIVDGLYGNQTRLAIIAFQQDNGLPISGVVDEFLIGALTIAHRDSARQPASTKLSSPSFDCAKGRSTTERAICASKELSDLDTSLSAAYIAAEASGLTTKQQQTEWLRVRDACNGVHKCIATAYLTRLREFEANELSDQPVSSPTDVPILDLSLQNPGQVDIKSADELSDVVDGPPTQEVADPAIVKEPGKLSSGDLRSESVDEKTARIQRMCEENQITRTLYKCACVISLSREELLLNNTLHPNDVMQSVIRSNRQKCKNTEAIYTRDLNYCKDTFGNGFYQTTLSLPSFCHCYADNAPNKGSHSVAICQAETSYPIPENSPLLP